MFADWSNNRKDEIKSSRAVKNIRVPNGDLECMLSCYVNIHFESKCYDYYVKEKVINDLDAMTVVAAYIKPVLILSTVPLIWNEVMRFSFWEGKEKRVFVLLIKSDTTSLNHN